MGVVKMRVRDYAVDVCMCLARTVGDGKGMPPLPYVTHAHFNSKKVQKQTPARDVSQVYPCPYRNGVAKRSTGVV